jgi:HK97 family phage major capsid protein
MRKAQTIAAEIRQLSDQVDAIVKKATAEERELTMAESATVDDILGTDAASGRINALQDEHGRALRFEARVTQLANGMADTLGGGGIKPSAMRDRHGNAVHCLAPQEKVASVVSGSIPGGLGEVIRAMATGHTRNISEPVRNAMSTSGGLTGSFLVPGELSASVIDLARARSVVLAAGAMTVPMGSTTVSMAKVIADPAIVVKAENDAFADDEIQFGQVLLNAYTFGCVITASRELAEDAPNFAQIVEQTIAAALAAKLDYFAVQGTGSAQPVGLLFDPNIGETGSIGGLTWEDLAAAASEVRQANHEPNAIILGVEPHEDLMISTTSSNDATASKTWLLAPPALEGQNLYPTNNCPLAQAVCGDFTKLAWGIRQDVLIEASTSAGEAFNRHQLKFKITFRGDTAVMDASAFHRLAGITS